MIGLIKTDVQKMCENRNETMNKLQDLIQKNEDLSKRIEALEKLVQDYDKELSDYSQLLSELKNNCVMVTDIQALVEDIKQSFELFVNATPRGNESEIAKRLEELEKKFESVPDIKLIDKSLQAIENVKVPKLNIQKKNKA